MRFFSVLQGLVAALAWAPAALAYGNPQACSGDCWSHDPCVVRRAADGVYFRFETGSEIGIWKSPGMNGPWTYQGKVLPNGSSINKAGNKDLWAPDVTLVGNTYILYYSVSTSGSQDSAIGYATSSTMDVNTWTDHGSVGIASSKGSAYNAIDANLVKVGNAYYMTFGSFWGDIYQVGLNAGATAAVGAPYRVAYNGSGTHAVEGSFVWFRSPFYYLFFSAGICCGFDKTKPAPGAEYSIRVCRSSNVNGPYVDANGVSCTAGGGTVVLASHGNVYGPGGQGVFADPKLGTVLYYHYADTKVGLADSQYRFGWNTVGWSTGWPTV